MRNSSVQRMNFGLSHGESNFLGEPQIFGRSEVHRDEFTVENRFDDAGSRFETGLLFCASDLLDESTEATRPVAAHVGGRTIAVVEIPGPIALTFAGGDEQK